MVFRLFYEFGKCWHFRSDRFCRDCCRAFWIRKTIWIHDELWSPKEFGPPPSTRGVNSCQLYLWRYWLLLMKSIKMFNKQTCSSIISIITFHEIKIHGRSRNGILHKICGLQASNVSHDELWSRKQFSPGKRKMIHVLVNVKQEDSIGKWKRSVWLQKWN